MGYGESHGLRDKRMKKRQSLKAPLILLGLGCFTVVCLVLAALFLRSSSFTSRGSMALNTYVPQTRTYYVAAEKVLWDYAPAGKDPYANQPIPMPYGEQTKYQKVRYIEYTDGTFTSKKPQAAWLGILGPVIRGVEGDTIKVVFLNRADKPYSMHPHGLLYDKDDEGATMGMDLSSAPGMSSGTEMGMSMSSGTIPTTPIAPSANGQLEGRGAKILPGERYTYTWHVIPESAPQSGEGGSKVWWYHSHVNATQDVQDGLVGPIVITSAQHARADATPDDVDKEFVTMFLISHEGGSSTEMKIGMSTATMASATEGDFKYTINGYIFNNLPGLVMSKGDKVRWYLLGMGGEMDLHTPHWHGEDVLDRKTDRYTDVMELMPGSMETVDMTAYNPGQWMYHCHVADHMDGGMMAMYTITP